MAALLRAREILERPIRLLCCHLRRQSGRFPCWRSRRFVRHPRPRHFLCSGPHLPARADCAAPPRSRRPAPARRTPCQARCTARRAPGTRGAPMREAHPLRTARGRDSARTARRPPRRPPVRQKGVAVLQPRPPVPARPQRRHGAPAARQTASPVRPRLGPPPGRRTRARASSRAPARQPQLPGTKTQARAAPSALQLAGYRTRPRTAPARRPLGPAPHSVGCEGRAGRPRGAVQRQRRQPPLARGLARASTGLGHVASATESVMEPGCERRRVPCLPRGCERLAKAGLRLPQPHQRLAHDGLRGARFVEPQGVRVEAHHCQPAVHDEPPHARAVGQEAGAGQVLERVGVAAPGPPCLGHDHQSVSAAEPSLRAGSRPPVRRPPAQRGRECAATGCAAGHRLAGSRAAQRATLHPGQVETGAPRPRPRPAAATGACPSAASTSTAGARACSSREACHPRAACSCAEPRPAASLTAIAAAASASSSAIMPQNSFEVRRRSPAAALTDVSAGARPPDGPRSTAQSAKAHATRCATRGAAPAATTATSGCAAAVGGSSISISAINRQSRALSSRTASLSPAAASVPTRPAASHCTAVPASPLSPPPSTPAGAAVSPDGAPREVATWAGSPPNTSSGSSNPPSSSASTASRRSTSCAFLPSTGNPRRCSSSRKSLTRIALTVSLGSAGVNAAAGATTVGVCCGRDESGGGRMARPPHGASPAHAGKRLSANEAKSRACASDAARAPLGPSSAVGAAAGAKALSTSAACSITAARSAGGTEPGVSSSSSRAVCRACTPSHASTGALRVRASSAAASSSWHESTFRRSAGARPDGTASSSGAAASLTPALGAPGPLLPFGSGSPSSPPAAETARTSQLSARAQSSRRLGAAGARPATASREGLALRPPSAPGGGGVSRSATHRASMAAVACLRAMERSGGLSCNMQCAPIWWAQHRTAAASRAASASGGDTSARSSTQQSTKQAARRGCEALNSFAASC
eukprot:scaffold32199_cov108-Isochrysis_galbana.AAC.7